MPSRLRISSFVLIALLLVFSTLMAPLRAEAVRIVLTYSNQDTLYLGLDNNISIGIYDGVKPYTVTVASGAVRVEPVGGTTHMFRIIPVRAGNDTVTVRDARGQSTTQAYSVVSQISNRLLAAERLVGDPFRFQLSGGVPPYSVTPFHDTAVSIKDLGNGLFEATLKDVVADLNVRDSKRGAMGLRLDAKAKPSFVPPVKAQLSIGQIGVGESAALTISGGTPPYKVSFSSDGVELKNGPSSSIFSLIGRKPGAVTVTARDSKGVADSQALQILWRGNPLSMTLSATSCMPGSSIDFWIGGGVAPYKLTPSLNDAVQIIPQSSGKYRIECKAPGLVTLTAGDSMGNISKTNLLINSPPLPPVTLQFSTVTIPVGSKADLQISGGKPPYQVLPSSPIARIEQASPTLFRVVGMAKGTVGINVRDSTGKTSYRAVSITDAHRMDASLSRTSLSAGESSKLIITYGKPPFAVIPSDASVIVIPEGVYFFNIIPQKPGSFTIRVSDSAGTNTTVGLTAVPKAVQQPPFNYQMLSGPPYNNVRIGMPLVFRITGGRPPYTVIPANLQLVNLRQVGADVYEARPIAPGSTSLLLRDSSGREIKHSLMIYR